jgi:hypothetical protein
MAAQSSPAQEPAFTNTTRVQDKVLSTQLRQVLILPSQPRDADRTGPQMPSDVIAKLPEEPQLLPEGYMLSGHKADIDRQADWLVIKPAKTEKLQDPPSLRLLPNRMLEILEANLPHKKDSIDYIFTGRVTEFKNLNYLLIDNLMEISSTPPAPKPKKPPKEKPVTKPATGRTPTADDVSEQLMKYKPLRPVVAPDLQPVPISKPANVLQPVGQKNLPRPEDTILIDRIGRVIPGEKWWMFAFEDRGDSPQHQPIRILPNRLLENAIITSKGGSRGVVFIISGEITVYNRTNYLLIRKALARRDMGNLR